MSREQVEVMVSSAVLAGLLGSVSQLLDTGDLGGITAMALVGMSGALMLATITMFWLRQSRKCHRYPAVAAEPLVLEPIPSAHLPEPTPVQIAQRPADPEADQPIPLRVYISCSSRDREFGQRLAGGLRSALGSEESVFFAESSWVVSDTESWERATRAIVESHIFIAVLSPEAMASHVVTEQIQLAWLRRNASDGNYQVVIPIRYRECVIPSYLGLVQAVDFRDPRPYEDGLADLLQIIEKAQSNRLRRVTITAPQSLAQSSQSLTDERSNDVSAPGDSSAPNHLVFVSHASMDNEFGGRLFEALQTALGPDSIIWYDSRGGLQAGDLWSEQIETAIARCDVFLLVLSPGAMRSPWVREELRLAWKYRNSSPVGSQMKKIIPIMYRQCEPWAGLRGVATHQTIDFSLTSGLEDAPMNQLLAAIHADEDFDRALEVAVADEAFVHFIIDQVRQFVLSLAMKEPSIDSVLLEAEDRQLSSVTFYLRRQSGMGLSLRLRASDFGLRNWPKYIDQIWERTDGGTE